MEVFLFLRMDTPHGEPKRGDADHTPHALQSKQKGDDMFIFHPLPAYFMPNLANRDAPAFQKLSLTLTNVLVQNVQAATRSNTYSGAVYSLA